MNIDLGIILNVCLGMFLYNIILTAIGNVLIRRLLGKDKIKSIIKEVLKDNQQ